MAIQRPSVVTRSVSNDSVSSRKSLREATNSEAGTTIFSNIHAKVQLEQVYDDIQENEGLWLERLVIFPGSTFYRTWWVFTVIATALTFFFETYQIGFGPGGLYELNHPSTIINFLLNAIFGLDMLINFNLAFFNDQNELVYSHRDIAKHYVSFYFWIDLVGVMPFYYIVLQVTNLYRQNTQLTQFLSLLRMFRLVRMRRVKQLFDIIKFSSKVSLISLTLIRNGVAAAAWTHFAACVFYFIAKQHDFDEDTWIGPHDDLSPFQIYITTLYWSVVTFTTVGYGDLSPINKEEKIFAMIYMLLNITLMSFIIGSITLLVVKNDSATGKYRHNLRMLYKYCLANNIMDDEYPALKTQLKTEFNEQGGDEVILSKFPKTMRQKVLYELYSPSLQHTYLLKGIRQHFITDFLSACRIVIFSSEEELLTRGAASSDLFFLVSGAVELSSPTTTSRKRNSFTRPKILKRALSESHDSGPDYRRRTLDRLDFINELSFFTESPQMDTVRTLSICKMLMISKQDFMVIAEDHPNSFGKLLKNLVGKVNQLRATVTQDDFMTMMPTLPMRMEEDPIVNPFNYTNIASLDDENDSSMMAMPALPMFPMQMVDDTTDDDDDEDDDSHLALHQQIESDTIMESLTSAQIEAIFSSVQDMLENHITRQKDESTTRFLLAASRDDVATINIMCEQGFDPNSADMDYRTALMVASMNGNVRSVEKLLDYGANPQLKDHHGTCAMLEAIHSGHDQVIGVLLKEHGCHHADVHWLENARASSLMNQAVFDRDLGQLKRLIRANVNVNAKDYDSRRPIHIAASEGNMAEFQVLVEAGADLEVKDRWGNTVMDEARRSKNPELMDYLLHSKLCRSSLVTNNASAGGGDGNVLSVLNEEEYVDDYDEPTTTES